MIQSLAAKLKELDSNDQFRVESTTKLLEKL